jgi:putative membrane protein
MLKQVIQKNDAKARLIIGLVSVIVFVAVVALKYVAIPVDPSFDVHIFATVNAYLNGTVAVLLVIALIAVKMKNYSLHKRTMLAAILLSVVFLLSYIAHHALAGDTSYPKDAPYRAFYLIILLTHIMLAGIILPFILFTAYRALTAEFPAHKKLARITWPIWFYVACTGVIVYLMIHPYYT